MWQLRAAMRERLQEAMARQSRARQSLEDDMVRDEFDLEDE